MDASTAYALLEALALTEDIPGYCYQCAGWTKGETKRHKLFLYAPTTGA